METPLTILLCTLGFGNKKKAKEKQKGKEMAKVFGMFIPKTIIVIPLGFPLES